MTISKSIRDTRDKIVQDLNDSGLPIDVMVLIIGEIARAITVQADQAYADELRKEKEADKNELPSG